jgi:hypothetical protein
LDLKNTFASDKPKRRQIWQLFTSEVNTRFHWFVSRSHDAEVVLARFQIRECRRAFLRMIA